MVMKSTRVALVSALAGAWLAVSHVAAHSWIDCLDTSRTKLYDKSADYIFGGAKGNGFCDGYAAGFPGRGSADIGPAFTHKMLKNEVEAGTPVCQAVDANTYSGWRKRLAVEAGKPIYVAYLENGHISKDKIGQGTQYGFYWTGKPGSKLVSTKDISQSKLVDGKLHNFDDGNCGESVDAEGKPTGRAGDGKPCIGDFTIPAGTPPGIYHFVWYWKYYMDDPNAYVDKAKAAGYFGAAYSSCFEVEVKPSAGGANQNPTPAPATKAPAPAPAPAPAATPAMTPAPTPKPTPAPTPPTPAPAAKAPAIAPAPTPAATKAGSIGFDKYTPQQLAEAVASAKDPSAKKTKKTYCH
jgi:hypothetical protein